MLGKVVGCLADVFFQARDDFALGVANHHAVSGRARIAARATIDIGLIESDGLVFWSVIAEEAAAPRNWWAFIHVRTPKFRRAKNVHVRLKAGSVPGSKEFVRRFRSERLPRPCRPSASESRAEVHACRRLCTDDRELPPSPFRDEV